MNYDNAIVGICERLMTDFKSIAGENNPYLNRTLNGTLDALSGPYNNNTVLQSASGGNDGTHKQVRVRYRQRGADTATITDDWDDLSCTGGDQKVFKEALVEVTEEFAHKGIEITEDQLADYCINDASYEAFRDEIILGELDLMHTELNANVLSKVFNNCVGVNIRNLVSGLPSSTPKDVNVLTGNCNDICHDGFSEMIIDYRHNGLKGKPILIGQGNMEKALLNLDLGCCNDAGVDINKVRDFVKANGYAMFIDQAGNSILGDDVVLMLAPGAVQFLTWNAYNGFTKPWTPGGTYAHILLQDPWMPGLKWDWNITYTPCADRTQRGKYNMQFKLAWDIFCTPSDAFAAADSRFGLTGAMLYTANSI